MHSNPPHHPTTLILGQALPGRSQPMLLCGVHAVNGNRLYGVPENREEALFAMGCFWGAERLFWQQPGIYSTAVGYCGGETPNPTYREVCSGQTGHTETVRVVFDPSCTDYATLLQLFWQNHDPAQGMRQGNDIGTQYRSALFPLSAQQMQAAGESRTRFAHAMRQAGDTRQITTAIHMAGPFYYAEEEHQQYLHKHPHGYCGLGGLGICLPR